MKQEWQPIETAPRDGTAILCYSTGTGEWPCIMSWNGKQFVFHCSPRLGMPQYWMPLPSAPNTPATPIEDGTQELVEALEFMIEKFDSEIESEWSGTSSFESRLSEIDHIRKLVSICQ